MKKGWNQTVFWVVLVLGWFNWSCNSNPSPKPSNHETSSEIRLGLLDNFSGLSAGYGLSIRNGVQMAIEEMNSQGGIFGKKVVLIERDDQGETEKSKIFIRELIQKEQVVAVIGTSASSRSIAVASMAQEEKVPMISPSSTHPQVTAMGNYIFRVCFVDTVQGPVMAKFLHEKLKVKRVALMRDLQSDYSLGLTQFFKQKMVELGGQVVSDQGYRAGDIDFKAQLTAIARDHPEVIYVPGYYADVINISKQARSLGIKAKFAGGDGWDFKDLFEKGGEFLEGSFFTGHFFSGSQDPIYRVFAKKYLAKYKSYPNAQGALGYDAAKVLFEAMKKSKAFSGEILRAEIAKTQNFHGVTGMISLDESRNAIKPVVILKLHKRKAQYVDSMTSK